MSTLYENIKLLCDEKGVSGGKMCLDIGVSKSLMTGLKMGRTKSINIDTAQKIADYFGASVDRVLGTEKKEKSSTPEGAELDFDDMQLLAAYKKADPITKEAILRILKLQ